MCFVYSLIINYAELISPLVHSYLFWLYVTELQQPQSLLGQTVTFPVVVVTDSVSQKCHWEQQGYLLGTWNHSHYFTDLFLFLFLKFLLNFGGDIG